MAKFLIVLAVVLGAALAVPLPREENDFEGRIVGGSAAGNGQYPHQISLRRGNSHFCGGSILSNRFVLTAAHCTHGQSPSGIAIVVGTNYLNSGGTAYGVAQIINHANYDPQDNANDISILVVSGSIAFTPAVKSITLASSNPSHGSQCILSGWGLTGYPGSTLPNALQHIGLSALDLNECARRLPGFPVYTSHVCTSSPVGQGACQGDSGGPLIAGGSQVGVVSWGIPCAKGNPDIFTSVAFYRGWINSITGI
ncbi:hypothetical protein ILUMI_00390 [Ignelater luminosus]|uniref:Peptidase S1 domain-containing protein n=1 Tax=Ignelater luminosus TaxID=2038154 RepID=A0A8K0DGD0_IGNLU|nr:hypothetical protein ILUMI_00390 [Ignelater luminosus]